MQSPICRFKINKIVGVLILKKLYISLGLSLVCVGLFFEFLSCILCVALIICTLIIFKNKEIKITQSFLIISLIPVAYLISIPFAVDSGLAFIGFLKFLPIAFFALISSVWEVDKKEKLIKIIPFFAVALVLVSIILSTFNNKLVNFFTVNGEISGFFQYPNTFALFLTISLLILINNFGDTRKKKIISILFSQILILGVLLSESRTGLILTIVFLIVCVFIKRYRKSTFVVLATSLMLSFCGLSIIFLTGNLWQIVSSLNNSFGLSTIIGRLLYALDAIPQILTHPFGFGYYGYYFAQASFQTGVYQVTYVHNDFLQLFLDAGWIAGIALIFSIVKSLFSKKLPIIFKMIIICISVFCLFDFHLQYLLIFMLLIFVLDFEKTFKKPQLKLGIISKVVLILVAVVNIYFAIVLTAEHFGFNDLSLKLYPYNTRIELEQLVECDDLYSANEIAQEIISKNEYVSYAYSVQAMYYYSIGSFQDAINYKLEEINLSKYSINSYTEFVYILTVGIQLYEEAGDADSAQYCRYYLTQITDMLEEVENNTSYLAYLIDDTPELELPEEYLEYINEFSN